MHPRAAEFRDLARERYEFDPDISEFSEGTKTARDAAAAVGCEVAQIASSIAVRTDDGLAVVVTSGANRLDTDTVAGVLGVDSTSLADPDEVKDRLGWTIGGVPPLCHATSVPVLLDETLFGYETVWAAAGTPTAVFPISPERLRALSGGRRATVAE